MVTAAAADAAASGIQNEGLVEIVAAKWMEPVKKKKKVIYQ